MHEGLPENFDFCEPNSVIVLNDLMEESKDNVAVTAIYIKVAHRLRQEARSKAFLLFARSVVTLVVSRGSIANRYVTILGNSP